MRSYSFDGRLQSHIGLHESVIVVFQSSNSGAVAIAQQLSA